MSIKTWHIILCANPVNQVKDNIIWRISQKKITINNAEPITFVTIQVGIWSSNQKQKISTGIANKFSEKTKSNTTGKISLSSVIQSAASIMGKIKGIHFMYWMLQRD